MGRKGKLLATLTVPVKGLLRRKGLRRRQRPEFLVVMEAEETGPGGQVGGDVRGDDSAGVERLTPSDANMRICALHLTCRPT